VRWVERIKSAFQKLKNVTVKNREAKEFGVAIGERIMEMIGLGGKKQPSSCGTRQVRIESDYYGHLVVHMRVPYCSDADLGLMQRAVKILEDEAVAMTPVDTGRLKNSRYREVKLEDGGKTVRGTFGYDVIRVRRTTSTGRTTYYALAVHNRNAHHGRDKYPRNPERAQWKFLETAINNQSIKGQIQELFR
jgi:hypothetical protein